MSLAHHLPFQGPDFHQDNGQGGWATNILVTNTAEVPRENDWGQSAVPVFHSFAA